MEWVLGGLVLILLGVLLRWILRLDRRDDQRVRGLVTLGADREAIFQPISLEMETQAAILGISLDDAISERDAGQVEIAWRLVRLAASEWDRLAEILRLLSKVMADHVGNARVVIPTRNVTAHHFKSRVMIDYLRMHELLDQLVFRSKLRFQLHLRMLRRAADTLSTEFRRAYRYADRTEDRPPELWNRLDYYFHDFDLITKETLLAFRALLFCLPHSDLTGLAADLKPLVRHGVRVATVPAGK
jgi:predicted ATP-dependent endonuclease of OLD family